MIGTPAMAAGWEVTARPPSLFRRYTFASYSETRAFLDRLAALSEETGRYPDLGFGTTFVNVTLSADGPAVTDEDRAFAERISALTSPAAQAE